MRARRMVILQLLVALVSAPASAQVSEAVVQLGERLTAFAASDTLLVYEDLVGDLPESVSMGDYRWVSAGLDSLDPGMQPTSESLRGLHRFLAWSIARAELDRRAGEDSLAIERLRGARSSARSAWPSYFPLDVAELEMLILEERGEFAALLETIEETAHHVPAGSYRLLAGWAARIRYYLGLLGCTRPVEGRFVELERELTGVSSVPYVFVSTQGDTLRVWTSSSTVVVSQGNVWTPGGTGDVFDAASPPSLYGTRDGEQQLLGLQAALCLDGETVVIVKALEDTGHLGSGR